MGDRGLEEVHQDGAAVAIQVINPHQVGASVLVGNHLRVQDIAIRLHPRDFPGLAPHLDFQVPDRVDQVTPVHPLGYPGPATHPYFQTPDQVNPATRLHPRVYPVQTLHPDFRLRASQGMDHPNLAIRHHLQDYQVLGVNQATHLHHGDFPAMDLKNQATHHR